MFKRTGAPELIEVLDFREENAKDVSCPKCAFLIGRKDGKIFKPASGLANFAPTASVSCPRCTEGFNV